MLRGTMLWLKPFEEDGDEKAQNGYVPYEPLPSRVDGN
jgi:hypothetical protein